MLLITLSSVSHVKMLPDYGLRPVLLPERFTAHLHMAACLFGGDQIALSGTPHPCCIQLKNNPAVTLI